MTETEFTGKLNAKKIMAMLSSDKPLAETLDEALITKIQSDCQELYEKDAASCQGWRDAARRLMEQAGLKDKTRDQYIKAWQANIQMPDLMFAAMQFNARTYPEYVKDGKVCQYKANGKMTPEKEQRGGRVTDYMNWQLTQQVEEWPENFDKLLLLLPIVGHMFKMTCNDEQLGRLTDTLLMPDMVTVDNTPNNPDWMRRISIDMTINQNVYASRVAAGVWRKVDIESEDESASDRRYMIVQMHCWLDLDEDGYDEPYIATFGKDDWKLLSVVPRYDEDSLVWLFNINDTEDRTLVGINAVEYITSYMYYPAPDGSALGMGIGHLTEKLTRARNSAINQIQDAGTKINLSSGLIRSGVFRDDGEIDFEPGEFKIVDAAFSSDDVSKSIFPLPVNQPSSATFEVFQTMGDTINRIAQTGEIMSGEGVPANMPATSVLAIIEQGKVGQRVVLKRINQSLTKELRLIYRLNSAYLNNAQYQRVLDQKDADVRADFDLTDCDITPVADPMFSTRVERLMRAQAAMQAGIQSPLLMKSYLVELGYDEDEAAQLASGDAQMKAVQAQAQAQSELMKQQKDVLAQQEHTHKAQADAMDRETRLMEAKIRLAEMESKLMLDRANAAKIMAETMALETEAQLRQNDETLRTLALMPAALPTIEEMSNDNTAEQAGEGEPGGLQPVAPRPGDQSGPANLDQSSGIPEQPEANVTQQPNDAGTVAGTPHPSPSAVGGGESVGDEGGDLPA